MRSKFVAALMVAAATMTACGSASTPAKATSPHGGPSATAALPTPTPIPPLAAPAVVQVENSPAGRPQSGLGAAQIVYEYVAEGGIGRFSLVFFGAPTASQVVGPVRSARTVTVQLEKLYHGFVAYSGADSYVLGLLGHSGLPSFNEDTAGGNLFRIGSRPAPHNLYTNGTALGHLQATAGLGNASYQLWTRTTTPPPSGTPVLSFTVPVSQAERPVFTWHPELAGFTRTEDTGSVRDPQSGVPIVIPTVIVQQVSVTTEFNVRDVNGNYGVDQGVTATGNAQVFTGGRVYNATWTQPAQGPPQFALANGSPAPILPGEVWISLVPTGQPAIVR